MNHPGVLISFEGIDGSGKSTQAELLQQFLKDKGYQVIFIREPGGTAISESIRKILLDKSHSVMHPRTELLLFLAARAELVNKVIAPAITRGKIVVTDRFSDSTFAYQIHGRQLPDKIVRQLNRFAADSITPDLTFLVDLDVKLARRRLKLRKDRMESSELTFHRRVRNGFLEIAKTNPRRVRILDGRRNPDELWREVSQITLAFLRRRKIGSRRQSSG